jgi:soluble lytic murein transglycosylase-like protein
VKNKVVNFAIGAFIGLIISLYAANQRVEADAGQVAKEYPIGTPVVKVVEIKEIETDKPEYFNVPLSHDIQDHIFEVCEEYGIAPALVVAMIAQESDFGAHKVGDGGDSAGLLQVQQKWHQERMDRLGCDNLLDPYQNITVAVDYIAELKEINSDLYWVLMAYNGGSRYATKRMESGEYSEYAVEVTQYAAQLESR